MTERKPAGYWTDERVLAEGRLYASRAGLKRNNESAYNAARRRGLLYRLYPSQQAHYQDWTDERVLDEGRRFSSRKEFERGNRNAYNAARRRNLVDQLYPSQQAHYQDWSDDTTVLLEGRKYASRAEFYRQNQSAYQAARRRNLLDLIDFPENNAPGDNDTIYLWRAVGKFHENLPVFKIGVTSQRLGDHRIHDVAKAAGFTAALVAAVPTWIPANYVEDHLHEIGIDPGWRGFDGATEFRALNPANLEKVLHLMNGYACPDVEMLAFDPSEVWSI